ncbi:MAG TPA: VWA domain-containing protein [Acidobacteriaceae bacterium]|nr:VWA domain-containing protein [Acidobacteriaceae bacterium]
MDSCKTNRLLWVLILAIAAPSCLAGPGMRATAQQANAPAPASAASSHSSVQQPNLSIDTDPVPSPDDQTPTTSAAKPTVPASAAPQPTPPPPVGGQKGQFTFRSSVNEVVIYATVVDDHQHLITTLRKRDFTVYEDGVQQTISSFRREDVPISLAILIDNSGSMREKRSAVNVAALDLVRASNPQDESFIVNFSDEAILDQDFTSNINLLEKGLTHIDSKGGTALYDAVVAAADHLAKAAKRQKQVILIITDGEDNSSSTSLQETVRRIQALHGPIVYAIGLLFDADSGREAHRARKALQLLTDETGGLAFFPKSLDQVDSVAQEVAKDIRSQYIIGYRPSKPISEGGYRTIRVTAKAKGYGKLTVRTREGYQASPQGTKKRPGSAAAPAGVVVPQ